jgi:hypothetical protein
LLLLLLLSAAAAAALSPLCRVSIHVFPRQTMSLGDTLLQLLSFSYMVPLFLVPVLVLLYFYVSTFRIMCAVPNVAVFCTSLTSWCPGMSLTCFLNDLEMVSVAPIINCYHPRFYIPHALYFYCEVFIFYILESSGLLF